MSLPLVASAMNLHSVQIRNMRTRCLQEAYLKKHGLNKNLQPNLTSSKARLHKRKSTRKKTTKQPSPLIVVDENDSESKKSEKSNRLCNQGNKRSRRVNKNRTAKNTKDLNNSSSTGIVCSVRKLITSYSNRNISSTAQNLWKTPKVSPRPKTSSGEEALTQLTEIKIKRQSCPPPILPQSTSPASRNAKLKKVYYSEPHSQIMTGVPCVPPVSPLNDGFVTVEIVPCLADIKSQQLIKSKLRCLVTQRQKQDEKLREKIQKEVKRKERERSENLRQQRRAEIYALNEVMTEHERNKFLQFMKEKNEGPTSISLHV
ncbi:probable serine/threonine-protein kinase irlA [Dendronephthya gigantea]|uniref:probable serine/threonine-protein kinase irlA n=1 Tax=Dendronephthya gigantea TaxID=151771 RepID=UPI001069CA73|nr:probable serine/threonine-protein kinase irlA [Dendronephthya gigantea]